VNFNYLDLNDFPGVLLINYTSVKGCIKVPIILLNMFIRLHIM